MPAARFRLVCDRWVGQEWQKVGQEAFVDHSSPEGSIRLKGKRGAIIAFVSYAGDVVARPLRDVEVAPAAARGRDAGPARRLDRQAR